MSYCRECGTKRIDILTGFYDEETGEKATKPACPKLGCPKHCKDTYGFHDYGWFSAKCSRCGKVQAPIE